MSKTSTANFFKGMFIEFKGVPHQITEFQHVNPGKGSAFLRTRLKNLTSGRVQEFTYKSGEMVDELPVAVREMQYLYKDTEGHHFMDGQSYEQLIASETLMAPYALFMKEGESYQILVLEEGVVGVRFPKKVRLVVTEADDAVKGNTASGATKEAILETGLSVQVPLFIKTGDVLGIDPETGNYLERIS